MKGQRRVVACICKRGTATGSQRRGCRSAALAFAVGFLYNGGRKRGCAFPFPAGASLCCCTGLRLFWLRIANAGSIARGPTFPSPPEPRVMTVVTAQVKGKPDAGVGAGLE